MKRFAKTLGVAAIVGAAAVAMQPAHAWWGGGPWGGGPGYGGGSGYGGCAGHRGGHRGLEHPDLVLGPEDREPLPQSQLDPLLQLGVELAQLLVGRAGRDPG